MIVMNDDDDDIMMMMIYIYKQIINNISMCVVSQYGNEMHNRDVVSKYE